MLVGRRFSRREFRIMTHGSMIDPPNRFAKTSREQDFSHLEWDEEYLHELQKRPVEYLSDASRSIVSENDSPDIPFRYSVNPYRGCAHGCAYCYARNTHEYLGFNAGLDFETRIVVKHDAPDLLRQFLSRDSWKPEPITFSGVTDCYQPAEREFRLTRQCLEVVLECMQPVSVITKNALVLRDLDVLCELARCNLVHVFLSITSLDPHLARTMEPRTSTPSARLRAVQELAGAGVPVGVMLAPITPGLNDSEIPSILEAAKNAGAKSAGYVFLRLPLTVEPVFLEWLRRTQPSKARRVERRLRQSRHGKLSNAVWGERLRGTGELADQIGKMFRLFRDRVGFEGLTPLDATRFRPPPGGFGQLRLF
jgi:DNA repair photolyase